MTTTTRAPASNGNTPTRTADGAARQSAVKPPRRPNTARIALGAVVVGLSALGAVTLFSNAADRVAVIAVARDVAPGAAVTEADLRNVSISTGEGLDTIDGGDFDRVIGRTAVHGLTAGSLVTPAQLADGPAYADGSVLVGALLSSGQFPVDLEVGDTVQIIETTAPDATGSGDALARGVGTVAALTEALEGQSDRTVSIAVPGDDAAAISAAGAAGRVSLVVTP